MSKHTPGPWRVVYASHPDAMNEVIAKVGEDYWRIAYILRDRNVHQRKQDDANARLIAAAPDMREELTKALDWLASYPGGGASNRYDAIRALLARIDEETP